MRILFGVAALVLAFSASANAQGFGVHIIGGVTIGEDLPDPRVDNPGFNAGAGIDYGFSQNFVLRASAIYTFFPFWSGELPTDVGASVSDGTQRNLDFEFVLRLSPMRAPTTRFASVSVSSL